MTSIGATQETVIRCEEHIGAALFGTSQVECIERAEAELFKVTGAIRRGSIRNGDLIGE